LPAEAFVFLVGIPTCLLKLLFFWSAFHKHTQEDWTAKVCFVRGQGQEPFSTSLNIKKKSGKKQSFVIARHTPPHFCFGLFFSMVEFWHKSDKKSKKNILGNRTLHAFQ